MYCVGGDSSPVKSTANQSMFTFFPAGAHTPSAWSLCPSPTDKSMQPTHSIRLGSCFQTASTWQQAMYSTSNIQSYIFPGIVHFDMRDLNISLLSSIFNRDQETTKHVLYFSTETQISIKSIEEPGTSSGGVQSKSYDIMGDINVVNVIQASIVEIQHIQTDYDALLDKIDIGTGAAYRVLVTTLWALLINSQIYDAKLGEAVIVVADIAHNPITANIVTRTISFTTQHRFLVFDCVY